MATSGSTDFSLTSREIITQALVMLSAVQMGIAPPAEEAEFARVTLNQMIKTWGATGRLWLTEDGVLTPVLAQVSYDLPSTVRKVYSVRRLTSGSEVPLIEYSRSDYDDLPNKTATGCPVGYYFDPQRVTKSVRLWLAPDATITASTTFPYTYARVIEDVDALDDEPDLPQEWIDPLIYGLARRLGPTYGAVSTLEFAELKEVAERLYLAMSITDQEQASIMLQPAG